MRLLLALALGLFVAPPAWAAGPVDRQAGHAGGCDSYGAGYLYLPATGTCLRIGGSVSYDYQYRSVSSPRFNSAAVSPSSGGVAHDWVRARATLDTRTATAHGTVRTVVSIKTNRPGRRRLDESPN